MAPCEPQDVTLPLLAAVIAPMPKTPEGMRARAAGYVLAARRILAGTRRVELVDVAHDLEEEAHMVSAIAQVESGYYPPPTKRREAPHP